VCGVGMTSVALESPINTLLLVPTKLLVINKVRQYPSRRCGYYVQGVTGDIDDSQLNYYVSTYGNSQPLKFICTYDSFSRVLPFAQRDDVQIVVDESDKIISMAPLKATKNCQQDIMNYMLSELEKIQERVTFISSTPVPLKYFEDTTGAWLDSLDHIVYNWTSTIAVTPMMCKRRSPLKSLKKEVIEPIVSSGIVNLGDRAFRKAIIFMNSVESICQVVNDCCISDISGIICSYSDTADKKLHRSNLGGIRVTDYNNLPTFTFITSTGFQGIDLDDAEAMNIIVTSGSSDVNSSWMLDLQLDVKQAVSRNRNKNNPNSDRFVFFYNQGIFDCDPNEILEKINATEERIKLQSGEFNKIQILDDQEFLSSLMLRYTYRDDNGTLTLNNLVFNHDRYTAIEVVKMYHSGFLMMSNIASTFSSPITIQTPKTSKSTSYQSIYKKYTEQLGGVQVAWTPEELSCENYNLIDSCYNQAGRLYENLDYAKKVLDVITSCDLSNVESAVKKVIKPGKHYCTELKETLQKIYDECGYNRKAKSTDIYDYYPQSLQPLSSHDGRYINVK